MKTKWLTILLAGLLLVVISVFSILKFVDFSWVIIFSVTFVYLLFIGIKSKSDNLKIVSFNLAAVFLALLLYEGYLVNKVKSSSTSDNIKSTGDYTAGGYMAPHSFLGYGPGGDGIFTSHRVVNDDVVYDVSYEIKNGLRYTPNSSSESKECVLFLGCSFTFGEGVADTSTLPYYFNQYLQQQYNVFNYGFHGYGPHQMLSNIENRVPSDIQNCSNKKIAIYSYLPTAHIARSAGYSTWDQNGPEYKIVDGKLIQTGTFSSLPTTLNQVLSKSFIYRSVFIERKPTHDDLFLVIEIVKKSKELLQKDQVEFYVFIWDNLNDAEKEETGLELFLAEMRNNNIRTFLLSDAIPDYKDNFDSYIIHKTDRHPNEIANKKIAAHIIEMLKDISTQESLD